MHSVEYPPAYSNPVLVVPAWSFEAIRTRSYPPFRSNDKWTFDRRDSESRSTDSDPLTATHSLDSSLVLEAVSATKWNSHNSRASGSKHSETLHLRPLRRDSAVPTRMQCKYRPIDCRGSRYPQCSNNPDWSVFLWWTPSHNRIRPLFRSNDSCSRYHIVAHREWKSIGVRGRESEHILKNPHFGARIGFVMMMVMDWEFEWDWRRSPASRIGVVIM